MTRAIAAVPGVLSQDVDLRKDDVVVRFDRRRTTRDAISAAIARSGYHPHAA